MFKNLLVDRARMGDVMDVLTEVYRLDVATWGDTRTALVFRCVAGATLKEGRPTQLNTIALTLNLGLATVHDRIRKLENWTDPDTHDRVALVQRVADGYTLTDAGQKILRCWLANLGSSIRCVVKPNTQSLESVDTSASERTDLG